jgi:hypothetical protein
MPIPLKPGKWENICQQKSGGKTGSVMILCGENRANHKHRKIKEIKT